MTLLVAGQAAQSATLIVLGIAQDGGVPQTGSENHLAWKNPGLRRLPTALGLIDERTGTRFLFEATPALSEQLHRLHAVMPREDAPGIDGIFLTHAHIGHYTGLMLLGHESLGAKNVPVYVMPRMAEFLTKNGPWDQLIRFKNIRLVVLSEQTPVELESNVTVTAIAVPHRQEYSEVVAYRISGPRRSVLFVPDIDSWREWDTQNIRLEEQIASVDVAYLDGTFFADGEIPGRDMSGFPHPRIQDTMERLKNLPESERKKVRFIHLNHTNPALMDDSVQRQQIKDGGFGVAVEGEQIPL